MKTIREKFAEASDHVRRMATPGGVNAMNRHPHIGFRAVALLLAAVCLAGPGRAATTYVWDNSSGDGYWANPLNWTADSGVPGPADTATFNDTNIGSTCRITSDVAVAKVEFVNKAGTNWFEIGPGKTWSPRLYEQACQVYATNRVVMRGGGTFAPRGDVWVSRGGPNNALRNNEAVLVVSNVTFDSTALTNLYVGYTYSGSGGKAGNGTLNLTNAQLVCGGSPNILATRAELTVGYSAGSPAYGLLLLPGALTNITTGTKLQVGWKGSGTTFLDFGKSSAIRSIRVGSDLYLGNGRFRYERGGTCVTGFPVNVDLSIGSAGKPGTLHIGHYYSASPPTQVMTNFGSFTAWINELYLCQMDNNNAGTSYAELDLSEKSVLNPKGSITPSNMAVPTIVIGNGSGYATATLRLPSTMTNITCKDFTMGQGNDYNPATSVLSFGTNTHAVTFTVSNSLSVGRAAFKVTAPGGQVRDGFPAGSRLRVGSPSKRGGAVKLGRKTGVANFLFGRGLADVALYATSVSMSWGVIAGAAYQYHDATNDFREATRFVWDVSGPIDIGCGLADRVLTYLPANGTVACSNLTMGYTANLSAYNSYPSLLVLSNTLFAVSNKVTLMETAIVTNFVSGRSCGFDMGTTNLDIQDPAPTAKYTGYARLVLRFTRDPLDGAQPYWGLRMKGNGVNVIQALTNTSPQRLSWTTTGLSPGVAARFGIYYNAARNVTYVGVAPRLGTLVVLR